MKPLAACIAAAGVGVLAAWSAWAQPVRRGVADGGFERDMEQGTVHCANLIYGRSKTSVCFADEFLSQLRKDSHVRASRRFRPVKLDSRELFRFPFAVMTGEGSFRLTEAQRSGLRRYLLHGGFLVASAGCSSSTWDASFRREIKLTFPDLQFTPLPMSHPVFHTVYDIDGLDTKRHTPAHLEALEYEGKVVLVYSPEGLNDTGNAGPGCCCCGGNEILNARKVNANLLAYALTH
ncbi:MAG: DUF4159 domain-containing protein [Phycisphaerae bacterium]|nr:DUF4159 domain-containing protein [Phycisphaerae bacterium]